MYKIKMFDESLKSHNMEIKSLLRSHEESLVLTSMLFNQIKVYFDFLSLDESIKFKNVCKST